MCLEYCNTYPSNAFCTKQNYCNSVASTGSLLCVSIVINVKFHMDILHFTFLVDSRILRKNNDNVHIRGDLNFSDINVKK